MDREEIIPVNRGSGVWTVTMATASSLTLYIDNLLASGMPCT